jgi:phosphatidylserine decarboxylase
MAKEGIPFVVLFAAPAVILLVLGFWVGAAICLVLAAYMTFFFRDPERQCTGDERSIVSPADGRVVLASALSPQAKSSPTQVSIFLSPLDVHVNRSPIAGQIIDLVRRPGKFHIASRDIASVENEQNIITVRGQYVTIMFRQVAGVLARRLVLWKKVGDYVRLGERIGLMKFGSRIDVIMPPEVEVVVRKGDRVLAGVSVIGRVRCRTEDGDE